MRYRKLDPNGDYSFGQGDLNFYINIPETVAQSILTRLNLGTDQWFLNLDEGTPYSTAILGTNTGQTRDAAVRARIAGTQGVLSIDDFTSQVDGRAYHVTAKVTTIYGATTVEATL